MTKEERKLHIKATALNKIRKFFHPLYKHYFTHYEDEGSSREQLCDEIKYIIECMEIELNKLNKNENTK